MLEVERTAIPGPGSCGGMYTANTMASAIEALGLSLPGSSAQEAVSPSKHDDAQRAGAAALRLVQEGMRPRDILTRRAFENAITVVIALGGSTNAVLHLLAIAHEAGIALDIDDFDAISERTPPISERTTRVNMVEISVIVPKKTAPMSPIMVHTCGSVTVIIS